MKTNILVIQAHPDNSQSHFCHALEKAYIEGAIAAGHETRRIQIADLDFPLIRSQQQWEKEPLPTCLQQSQADIEWCDHLVLIFPLWLGDMPALLKAYLEQVARPDFAFNKAAKNPFEQKRLLGRSARVVATMGMPALIYRWFYRAHSIKSLERNILGFIGFAPIDETLIGSTNGIKTETARKWLSKLKKMGEKGI
ncbi:MAG TPA: NAD(P)H-dependent oxidoreductase [Cellvibrionaceae bacterium]